MTIFNKQFLNELGVETLEEANHEHEEDAYGEEEDQIER
jgi:hypothetical protein